MTAGDVRWRVFPWDSAAADGEAFSSSYLPDPTGRGRFDLPARLSPVLYLAESPAHAVAELIHASRGRSIDSRHLTRAGRHLALVEVGWHVAASDLADLCDPTTLARLGVAPDQVASRHRSITQPVARAVWDAAGSGLRWWSRFWGDWHTTVVFTERAVGPDSESPLRFGEPRVLEVDGAAVREAADLLGIRVR